jgi:hypothetical protein
MPNMTYLKHALQARRLKNVERIAGPRYDARINVEAPLKPIFEALCRTDKFYLEVRRLNAGIAGCYKDIGRLDIETLHPKYEEIDRHIKKLATKLNAVTVQYLTKRIGWQGLHAECEAVNTLCYEIVDELRNVPKTDQDNSGRSSDGEIHYIYRLMDAVRKVDSLAASQKALVANNIGVLMSGEAGIGKTHLLCDLAQDRLGRRLPTYIFLGEEFTMANPLENMAQLIGNSTDYKPIVKAINDLAAQKDQKTLIIIDAINEAQAKVTWTILRELKSYKNLAFIISVRRGYEKAALSSSFAKTIVRVEHEGFTINEWQAVTAFFNFFNVPLPEVPILAPEFRNPLFLKLFCETYDKPSDFRGHLGTTKLFEAYVKKQGKSVMQAMGEPNTNNRVWNEIIRSLAIWMGDHGIERILENKVLELLDAVMPGKSKQLLRELERQWLLTKVPHYTKSGKVSGYEYRFPYQRFSDHFIIRYLLNKHLTSKTSPKRDFYSSTKLGKILAQPYRYSGLIEALAIQVPERLKGVDLVAVADDSFRKSHSAKESFLYSLIWRDLKQAKGTPKYFNVDEILNYINKYLLPNEQLFHEMLLTLISVAGLPDHPLNANILHGYLSHFTMGKRDAFWQKFLHYTYEESSIVGRLIEWGLSAVDKKHVSDSSLGLTATSMAWFLASSDRRLRDHTTKAMLSALTNRLVVVEKLLRYFEKVNDPYVAERLYAVAYGCCLRSSDTKGLKELAKYVYDTIFAEGNPPADIMLRDYARGVVEAYLRGNGDPSFDPAQFRPPYNSNWPERVPTLKVLKKKYREDGDKPSRTYSSIWGSVMYGAGGLADFGNYVVNTNLNNFSGTRLNSAEISDKQLLDEFAKRLSDKEKTALEEIRSEHVGIPILDLRKLLGETDEGENAEPYVTPPHIKANTQKFRDMLKDGQYSRYKAVVIKYMAGEHIRHETEFDDNRGQRWIFQKVIKLGWKPSLHGEYDNFYRDRGGSNESRRERIGKKYQWIALHELLARVADNFQMKNESDRPQQYDSPAQISIRDIDPTHTLKRTLASHESSWWLPIKYDGWKAEVSEEVWKRDVTNDLPDFKKLLRVKDGSGASWLSLKGYYQWEQPIEIEDEERRYDTRRREVWYHVYGYLVRKKNAKAFYEWTQKQNFWNHWMPESHEFYYVFYREFPHYSAFDAINDPYYGRSGWVQPTKWRAQNEEQKDCPVQIMVANDEYMQESNSRDASVNDGFAIQLPCDLIYNGMKLSSNFPDGIYNMPDGSVALIDPSVTQSGPKALLADKQKIEQWLNQNDLTIVWTVMGEKMGIGGHRNDRTGRLMINGSFILQGGRVRGGIRTTYEK